MSKEKAAKFEQAKIDLINKHTEIFKKQDALTKERTEYMKMEHEFMEQFGVEKYFKEILPAIAKVSPFKTPPEDLF